MRLRTVFHSATAISATVAWAAAGHAAENAAGFYLLGAKTAMAGYVPPPGTYVTDINYFYSGKAGGQAAVGIALRQTGSILDIDADVRIDADAYVNAPVALWIAPEKVLGGNIGFGIMVPVGRKKVDVGIDAHIDLTLPNGTVIERDRRFDYDEASVRFGDPVLNALIGWHHGNWHLSVGALLNVPIGPWDTDSITNVSFHHWGLDTTGAVTWLDPARGHEVSVAAGFTFNWENRATDYKTGTEFHVEWALIQHVSKAFSLGLSGYHYQQLTGDSGAGTTLGDFEGRVTGLGPVLTYSFEWGKIPVTAQLEYIHEFEAVNRAEGDMGMLNISMPLSVAGH
ncbi:transporter [Hyphomicrobium sp.]|uniref:SphA family protein n=1 Tax=Hyphomicrobium sp. TaxID=82 RepID=UPI0025BCEA25|nr:transporter [Hyphomicrobium sp.]MCC7250263.1 transporter [Hyphomicrobium sp.]